MLYDCYEIRRSNSGEAVAWSTINFSRVPCTTFSDSGLNALVASSRSEILRFFSIALVQMRNPQVLQ
jgi:hypothetical protein